jgi:hypothetical protein
VATEPGFSHALYRTLLEVGLENGYVFAPFEEHDVDASHVCLLRHDVDADPGAALEIAGIESELGVVSTFFYMFRSPLYNLFMRANQELVEQTLALGHRFGLHYDPGFAPRAGRTHTEQITIELDVLEAMFGVRPGAVAFHQPSLVPGAMEIEVVGAVKANFLAGYHFVADPNMNPWVLDAFDLFRTRAEPKIQLLVHPLWWREVAGSGPEELWKRALLANVERSQDQLVAIEGAYGPRRRLAIERP